MAGRKSGDDVGKSPIGISPAAADVMLKPETYDEEHRSSHDAQGGIMLSLRHAVQAVQKSVKSVFAPSRSGFEDDETRLSHIDYETAQTMVRGGLDRFYMKYKRLIQMARHQMPSTELRFENIRYEADVPISKYRSATVGTKIQNVVTLNRDRTFRKVILNDLCGVIKPGTITLVIGGPSSGKTSFLRALAGRLKNGSTTAFDGKVLYNGLSSLDLDVRKVVSLIDQNDVHAPTLSVRETLQFADRCLNGDPTKKPEPLREVASMRTDLLLYLLGLHVCADTVIGNALLRGVSGGERKRVTVGEMLVGGQSIFLCDEISTGLDSAATYDIVKSLRTWAQQLNGTVVVALLQPPAEVVELFDDVILLNDGNIMYHGALNAATDHFESLGFKCPERTDLADFLLTVTNVEGQAYRMPDVKQAPQTIMDFAKAYQESPTGKSMLDELSVGFQVNMDVERTGNFEKLQNFASFARVKQQSEFAMSFFESTWLVLRRQMMLTYRDKPLMLGKLAEALIVGALVGAIYFNANYSVYFRMLFFSAAILQRQGWQQIPITMELRNVFYKQRSRNFFRTWSYGIAHALVWSPVNFVVAAVMGSLIYWLAGLTPAFKEFMIFLLTLLAFQHAIGGYFMVLGSVTRTMVQAQAIAACSVMLFLVFSGNIIFPDLIPVYWKWFFWINPLAWTLRVLVLNEFSAARYDEPNPDNGWIGGITREQLWTRYQMTYSDNNAGYIWGGIAILFGYFLLFTALMTCVLHFVRYDKPTKELVAVFESDLNKDNTEDVEEAIQHLALHDDGSSDYKFTPVTLAFRNLWYWVPDPLNPKTEKVLLRGINGFAKPGTMTALMGSTGAGKTTLMDVIAGRKTGGRMEGDILVNGYPKNPKNFSRICGYCEQMDIHSATTTVREALIFSARLRQPAEVSEATKINFVEEVMKLVELDAIADKIVGTLSSGGLTVEQRKRLTLGVELVANPSVLFLDEPTSGLDARAANIVIRAVKNIAKSGRTVLCTIHQPSTNIFEYFDSLLLLKLGGYTVFFGALGENSSAMLAYFASLPNTRSCPPRYNPATYMLEVIGAGVGRTAADGSFDYVEGYKNSELCANNLAVLEEVCKPLPGGEPVTFTKDIATNFPTQLKLLVWRATKSYWRTPNYNFVRFLLFPIFALFYGSVFFNKADLEDEEDRKQANINSIVALSYMIMDFIGIVNLMTVLEITCAERDVFYRERASNMYSSLAYDFALFFAELPYLAVIMTMFVTIMYFMVGFAATAWQYFFYLCVFFGYCGICTYVGQFMCALMPNEKVANVAVGAISCLFNVFSGFLLPINQMKSWYKWVTYFTPSAQAFNALVSSQFISERADQSQLQLLNSNQTVAEFVEDNYGLNADDMSRNTGVIYIEWATTFLFTWVCLQFIKHIVR